MSKIIGVTVGTPISARKIDEELKPVKTVNGKAPDENGNVDTGGMTQETDPTVPAWAKQPNKPTYTATEVGAIPADALPEAINTALAQAKESGEFDGQPGKDGADGQPGADGKDGDDYVLTDADKQEIAEMAAELVDAPEGGGGSEGAGDNRFELIADVTAETDVVEMSISEDLNGNPFALSRCLVVVDAHPALEEDSKPGIAYVVGFNVSGNTWAKGLVKYDSPGNAAGQHSWRTTLVSTTIDGLVVPENVTVSYNNASMPNAQGYLHGLSPETRFPSITTGFTEDAYRAKTGINNVSIGSYVKSIGANTRLIVYGVRM